MPTARAPRRRWQQHERGTCGQGETSDGWPPTLGERAPPEKMYKAMTVTIYQRRRTSPPARAGCEMAVSGVEQGAGHQLVVEGRQWLGLRRPHATSTGVCTSTSSPPRGRLGGPAAVTHSGRNCLSRAGACAAAVPQALPTRNRPLRGTGADKPSTLPRRSRHFHPQRRRSGRRAATQNHRLPAAPRTTARAARGRLAIR